MAIKKIVTYGHPSLRKISPDITDFSDIDSLIQDLFDTMYANDGVGLAANQININNEKMIMASRTDPSYEQHRALLNQHKVRYQKVLESPFSTLSMAMIPELNALSINNVLIAELVCQHNKRLTWRYVDEFNHQTDFYLSMPPWLHESTTENLFLVSFKESLMDITQKINIDMTF